MLADWIQRLREASKDRAVLVEGKRDKQALSKFGIKNIFTLEGKRFADLPDLLEGYSEVILLFDLDKHGERIKEKVKTLLGSQGYILIKNLEKSCELWEFFMWRISMEKSSVLTALQYRIGS